MKKVLLNIIRETSGYNGDFGDQMCLYDDIGIDSLSIVDLITQVEKAFQISFLDSEIKEIKTVNQLISSVELKLQ